MRNRAQGTAAAALHGLRSKDFVPALEEFFGSAARLSASVVTRLTASWQEEQRRFDERDLVRGRLSDDGGAGAGRARPLFRGFGTRHAGVSVPNPRNKGSALAPRPCSVGSVREAWAARASVWRRAGDVPDEDLATHYSAAECSVLPSRYEGFGFPPLEAMACGYPVVVPSAGSLP